MKKIVIAMLLTSSLAATTSFASSVPVMDFRNNLVRVNVDRGLNTSVDGYDGHHTGYSTSIEAAIGEKNALQYSYTKYKKDGSIKSNEITGVHSLNGLVNVYGSVNKLEMPNQDAEWGYQVGLIGYTPIFPGVQAFAKVGVGDKIKKTYQVGATFKVFPFVDLHASYQRDEITNNIDIKRYNVGLGFEF